MNIIVARKLHERRYRANPVMTTGELLNLIGSDGMQEAINARWIVPDETTGFMMINQNGGKLLELEAACRCACGKTDCSCGPAGEAGVQHQNAMPMREAFAGFGLPSPSPTGSPDVKTSSPIMPRAQVTPTSSIAPQSVAAKSGDTVKVTDEGKEFEGQVSGFEPDGRIRLRWKGQRPVHDRPYGAGEYLVVNGQGQPQNEPHA